MGDSKKIFIDNTFLDKYISSAPPVYIVIFLCAQQFLQSGKGNFTSKDISDKLSITESDAKKGLEYWGENGENLGIIDERPVFKIQSQAPNYSSDEITYYINHNDDFRSLLNSAQDYMGKLISISEISILYSLHDWLRLPLEVIELLLAYCCENGHKSMRYIEKVAISWADEGVKDLDSALKQINDYSNVYMRIMKALGIMGKSPVPKQKEYMNNWTEKIPMDMIIYGCEKTALIVTNGNPFPYADKIFANWEKNGIDTLQKAKDEDERFAENRGAKIQKGQEQKTQKSKFNYDQREWNFKELERIKREEARRNMEE